MVIEALDGVVFSTEEIMGKVRRYGWFYESYSEERNRKMVRSSIQESILTNRIIRGAKRGLYIFLDKQKSY